MEPVSEEEIFKVVEPTVIALEDNDEGKIYWRMNFIKINSIFVLVVLRVKKLPVPDLVPRRAMPKSSGFDLFANQDFFLNAGTRKTIGSGISVDIPRGHVGKIEDRSSLASVGISVVGGVIDEDYKGELMIIMENRSDVTHFFNRGDRIAQLLLLKNSTPEVKIVEELLPSFRGVRGFGSTGRWKV